MNINDYLESFRRIEEKVNRMTSPAMQRQFELVRNSDFWHHTKMAQDMVPESLSTIMDSHRRFIPPDTTSLRLATDFLNSNSSIRESLEIWEQTTIRLSSISSLQVPVNFYPLLDELSSALLDVIPKEDHSDLPASITVAHPSESTKPQPITWEQLQNFLYFALSLIASFYIAHESTVQSEKQHKEQMIELHKQTEMIENKLDKNLEIQHQLLEVEKERLAIEQERLEREKILEEKFASFMEQIEPLITEDPNAPEE